MARLNVEGSALAKEICARLDVPYLQCGSLVLALSPEELPHLQKLYENGIANGVPGIRLLSAEETFAMEPNPGPHCRWRAVCAQRRHRQPVGVCAGNGRSGCAQRRGAAPQLPCDPHRKDRRRLGTDHPLRNCGNALYHQCGRHLAQAVHDMAAPHKFTIQPTRGEYYLLDKSEGSRVHHVIFQCPNENGKGVLVAPTVHGNLIVGPNADPVEGDDTACTAAGLAFVSAAARRSVPNIRFSESIRNFAGVRANVDTGDFVIGEAEARPVSLIWRA